MRREVTAALTASLVVFGQAAPLLAYTRGGGRGSVSAASRSGSYSSSGAPAPGRAAAETLRARAT